MTEKLCSKCANMKPVKDFNKAARNKDGYHSYCRECQKSHYQSNKTRHVQNASKNKARYQKQARDYMVEVMKSGCTDCGNLDIRVLEFDHVSGAKVQGVAVLATLGASLSSVKAEIEKCEVRCRNCHAIKTYERMGNTWHTDYMPQ